MNLSHFTAILRLKMTMLFLLLLLFSILISIGKKHKQLRNIRQPPGPPGLPFIGNLHQFDSEKAHEFLSQLSKKYGPLMSLQLGSVPVLVISSARMAKQALTTHDLVFSGRPASVGRQKLSYNRRDIAFSPYSDYWREMRKICVLQLFSLKRVQSFRPIREDEISSMIQKIVNLSSSSQLVDLRTIIMSLTSTIICRVAFGKRYDEEGHQRKRFDKLLQESQAMIGGFFISDYFPSFSWVDKFSGIIERLEKNFNELDLFYQELIQEHLNPNRPNSMKDDLLDLLIQLKEEQSSIIGLSWDHIKAILMVVYPYFQDNQLLNFLFFLSFFIFFNKHIGTWFSQHKSSKLKVFFFFCVKIVDMVLNNNRLPFYHRIYLLLGRIQLQQQLFGQ